ncbi:hypothetical protein BD410DRAFT_794744 [Rickenella mellea]|uniref:Secreted protein n=1 Tax=Rickenella mellea TaxID=50990 RepID=A0A4Y7PQ88_9AGAM|nr:hypothetical protein BD410DRAFT_794744 [Rickenella mellea]
MSCRAVTFAMGCIVLPLFSGGEITVSVGSLLSIHAVLPHVVATTVINECRYARYVVPQRSWVRSDLMRRFTFHNATPMA